MRTGLTKQEKTTDIWFDEKDPLIHIRTHIQHPICLCPTEADMKDSPRKKRQINVFALFAFHRICTFGQR